MKRKLEGAVFIIKSLFARCGSTGKDYHTKGDNGGRKS
jgi:hypothetical protein